MEMRPKMKCNMQHSAITRTCCVSTKMPHSDPNYFVRSLDTLGQSRVRVELGCFSTTCFRTRVLAPLWILEVETLGF